MRKAFDDDVKKIYRDRIVDPDEKEKEDVSGLYDQMKEAYEDAFIEFEDEKSILQRYKD